MATRDFNPRTSEPTRLVHAITQAARASVALTALAVLHAALTGDTALAARVLPATVAALAAYTAYSGDYRPAQTTTILIGLPSGLLFAATGQADPWFGLAAASALALALLRPGRRAARRTGARR